MVKIKIEEYIAEILKQHYNDEWEIIFKQSDLLKYLNLKSGAIHGNSKTRRSLANWYAIYSILTFYVDDGFVGRKKRYLEFDGYQFTKLFIFQRTQYGGSKLQNHGFNSRTNNEFSNKISRDILRPLIVSNGGKYMIHPDYLYVNEIDIVPAVIDIIKEYQSILYTKDSEFAGLLEELKDYSVTRDKKDTLQSFLTDDSEARIFEIISYAILETHYKNQKIYFGLTKTDLKEEYLQLYKTGRTNANDGGIDFVMRPLGRFFQVTEVDSYGKYFLDMEKVNHFPITFVIKTHESSKKIFQDLLDYGTAKSGGLRVLEKLYHDSIEEVITINELTEWLDELNDADIHFLIEEIDRYFKMEMNISEEE